MSIDEIIDWLEAIHCQHGSLHVTLDGKTMQVGEIASVAAMEIDHMRSEIVEYLGVKRRIEPDARLLVDLLRENGVDTGFST